MNDLESRDQIIGDISERLEAAEAEVERLKVEVEEIKGEQNDHECDTAFWKARCEKAEAEVALLKGETYCAYCGECFPLDAPDSCEQIGNHIQVCHKHPMRAVEAQRDAALEEVDRLKAHTWQQERDAVVAKDPSIDESAVLYEALEPPTGVKSSADSTMNPPSVRMSCDFNTLRRNLAIAYNRHVGELVNVKDCDELHESCCDIGNGIAALLALSSDEWIADLSGEVTLRSPYEDPLEEES